MASSGKRRDSWESTLISGRLSAVGRLTPGIAHELNNPLNVILGCAHLASDRLPARHAASEQLRAIERAALRCQGLLRELQDFASAPSGEEVLFELSASLVVALALVEPLARHRSLELAARLARRRMPVRGRPGELQTGLVHLAAHVIESSAPGGSILVETRAEPRRWAELLLASKAGGGAPGCRGGLPPPAGLGLALEIIRRHRGVLQEAPGALRLRLPLAV